MVYEGGIYNRCIYAWVYMRIVYLVAIRQIYLYTKYKQSVQIISVCINV